MSSSFCFPTSFIFPHWLPPSRASSSSGPPSSCIRDECLPPLLAPQLQPDWQIPVSKRTTLESIFGAQFHSSPAFVVIHWSVIPHADLTCSHLPAARVLPGHISVPWKTVAVWLLLHLMLAVTGYIQRGVIMAPILHKVQFISPELRKGEHGFHADSWEWPTVGDWCVSHGSLSCRQTPFPADVYEARCDDDGAYGTNNHQDHKEFAVVAAFLTGREGAADGCAVVLDANLRRQRVHDESM